MILRCILSFMIFTFLCLPTIIISVPIVAYLLSNNWPGYTTIFGNEKWGKGDKNPAYLGKTGWWNAFNWLVIRNPVNNLMNWLSVTVQPYTLQITKGNLKIGDKIAGGWYYIRMGWAWEYYRIIPYTILGSRRCVRFRAGWKIAGVTGGSQAPFVFSFNPVKQYLGI